MSNAFQFKDQNLNALILCCYISSRATLARELVYIGKTKRHCLGRQFVYLGISIFVNKALRYSDKDAAFNVNTVTIRTTLIALTIFR